MKTAHGNLISSLQQFDYTFTVFTSTYNRAHTLHRVYQSLKSQTYRNFEWLIIDDGSNDDTEKLVSQWQKEELFPIRYIYQENSGKHIAFNHGVSKAKGELFLTLDSDDSCVPEALEKLKYHWNLIPEEQRTNFSGITCLCQDKHGEIIGDKFPSPYIDSDLLEIRYRFKVKGEKWGFHTTNILRQFKFIEDIRQTYIPENLVWHEISRKYKNRFINEALRVYWIEGPSMVNGKNPRKNVIGCQLENLAILNNDIDWLWFSPLTFLRASANYVRSCFHLNKNLFQQVQSLQNLSSKLLWLFSLPLGIALYIKDFFIFCFL